MAALLKEYLGTSYLFGANAPFIEELYEAYLADAESVAPEWRRYFDQLQRLPGSPDVAHEPIRQSFVKLVKAPRAAAVRAPTATAAEVGRKQVWVLQLANNYRRLGMLQANVDPLKRFDPIALAKTLPDPVAAFRSDMQAEREQQPSPDIGSAMAPADYRQNPAPAPPPPELQQPQTEPLNWAPLPPRQPNLPSSNTVTR